ncbi:MAG: ABC transporter permease [Lachnospiraceae bacterium]|nr:ABC transporter permease [Lachnospiraceae bacterium]
MHKETVASFRQPEKRPKGRPDKEDGGNPQWLFVKLAYRNMKRSARDYLVYLLTMTVINALMYAFNSLIFQNGLRGYFEVEGIMEVMIGLATVFIVLIVAWLIHYMVGFMLEKRSDEFGIYLLLGMEKKDVSSLYLKENLMLGGISFLLGSLLGILFQQVVEAVMFAMVRMEYRLHISFHGRTALMTLACFAGCYLLALFRCRWKFRKMNIKGLMDAKRQNEEIKEGREGARRILLPVSVVFILVFWAWFERLQSVLGVSVFLVGLVVTIYLFYWGISAWLICYVRGRGALVYQGQNLFLLRQFAAKVRTMQFTMGTLTSLFTLALIGASLALMFSDYENTVLEGKFPFDVQVYSKDVSDNFKEELEMLERHTEVSSHYVYRIYTDKGRQANTWLLANLEAWGTMYQDRAGRPDKGKIEKMLLEGGVYYPYDTYMGISDYNCLREMLGYPKVSLEGTEYLVQVKPRLLGELQEIGKDLEIKNASGDGFLSCKGVYGEYFSQDGHNGADYVIVVPDGVLGRMEPFYSELVAALEGTAPLGLGDRLAATGGDRLPEFKWDSENGFCCGSDNIISAVLEHEVRDNMIPEIKYMLASVIIPLFYIGIVYVCVAVTVLSVQQLSDSAKYKLRYGLLAKLGLEQAQIQRLVRRQLAAYYLCPALLAIVISGKMILFVSRQFVIATGVPTMPGGFFLRSILLFFGIYLVYFVVTYVGFLRNVQQEGQGA